MKPFYTSWAKIHFITVISVISLLLSSQCLANESEKHLDIDAETVVVQTDEAAAALTAEKSPDSAKESLAESENTEELADAPADAMPNQDPVSTELSTSLNIKEDQLHLLEETEPQNGETAEEKQVSPFMQYLKGHFAIGTRTVYRVLTDDDSGHRGGWYNSGTFLGTIYGLDGEQNATPFYFYLSYIHNKFCRVELSYDYINARTKAMGLYSGQATSDLINGYEKTDGDVSLYGPTISIIGTYPNQTAFTPFAGLGLGYFFGDFDANSAWEYRSTGAHHVMTIDDEIAVFITAGVDWKFSEHWSLNGSLQYIKATADAAFDSYWPSGEKTQATQTGEFPLDNVAFRLGISYSF